jgi:hypothetical protein
MNDIYSYVVEAGPLRLVKSHQRTIQLMCQQTAECAFFISDYASRNFGRMIVSTSEDITCTDQRIGGRMAKSMTTDFSGKVVGYQKKFKQLKNDLSRQIAIVTAITVYQIANKIDDIGESTLRHDPYPYTDHFPQTLHKSWITCVMLVCFIGQIPASSGRVKM